MPRLRSYFCLEELSILFYAVHRVLLQDYIHCVPVPLTQKEKQCFVTMTYPVIFPK